MMNQKGTTRCTKNVVEFKDDEFKHLGMMKRQMRYYRPTSETLHYKLQPKGLELERKWMLSALLYSWMHVQWTLYIEQATYWNASRAEFSTSTLNAPVKLCAADVDLIAVRGAAPCTLLLRSSSRSSSPAPNPPGWSQKIRRFQELENKPRSCSPKPALCQPSHRWWWRRLSRETSDRDCPPDNKRLKKLIWGCTSIAQNF